MASFSYSGLRTLAIGCNFRRPSYSKANYSRYDKDESILRLLHYIVLTSYWYMRAIDRFYSIVTQKVNSKLYLCVTASIHALVSCTKCMGGLPRSKTRYITLHIRCFLSNTKL